MANAAEQFAAFEQLAGQLRDAAAAAARGLRAHRGTPAGDALDSQLEHTLDRIALMHGRGTYEALSTEEIIDTAVANELRMAAELGEPQAAAATGRARALTDAARRGARLHIREPGSSVRLFRGVHVAPLSPELAGALRAREDPYLAWGGGAVVILDDDELAAVRAAGGEVNVLFLDADELLDMEFRDDRPALEAELERRRAVARAAPDRVGDSRERHLLRLLHGQSIVLRNLRDRLAGEHPSAHAALLPILAEHRALIEDRMTAEPADQAADLLGAAIDSERAAQEHAGRWAAEPDDPSGLRERFRVVTAAGSHVPDLEQHRG